MHLKSGGELTIEKGVKLEGTRYAHLFENGVAVLDLIGPIFPRANMMTQYSDAVSVAQFTNDFIKAYANPAVRAIVFNIDSPGGDVRGIPDAAEAMFSIAKKGKKPVKSFASGMMASGAYYLGAIANDITASKASLTGSIGVVTSMRAKGKDEIEIVSNLSPNKRIDPSTPEGVDKIKVRLDDIAEIFIGHVGMFRGITREQVLEKYGQGDVFVGPRAKRQGLVDKIGTLSSVIEEAAKEADLRVSGSSRHRLEAQVEESIDTSILDEDDVMKLSELAKKFKQSEESVLDDVTLAAANEESDESADAAQGQEEQVIATAGEGQPTITREQLEDEFSDSAELFAMTMTTDSRIFPAQQVYAASDLINAKIDDRLVGGTVTFVNEEGEVAEGTREAAVRARYRSMPKHSMTQQSIKSIKEGSVVAKVLAENDPEKVVIDGPMTAERRAELLGTSEAGQRVLSQTAQK